MRNGSKAYREVALDTEVMSASPHRLIQILFEEVLHQLSIAKQAINNNHIGVKANAISRTLDIIITLKASLNKEAGGELALNLDRLYEFIELHLVQANINNSINNLDEVGALISKVKEGWDGIATLVNNKSEP